MGRIDFLYLLLVALVVATGIKVVGMLLVGAVVILPAVSAKNVSRSLAQYALISALLGMLTSAGGIALAVVLPALVPSLGNVPPGPLVVVAGTAVFIGTVAMKVRTPSTLSERTAVPESSGGKPRRPTV